MLKTRTSGHNKSGSKGKTSAHPAPKSKAGKKGGVAPAKSISTTERPMNQGQNHSSPHFQGSSKNKKSVRQTDMGRAQIARGSAEGAAAETVCREVACEGLATSAGYCRLHYIKNWKKIKRKEVILREKKLNQYIEELVAKYPDKYIEAIRQDLASDKDFAKVIYDLDLDEAVDDFDAESSESVDSLIDTIKRDFEDDSDAF